MPGPIDARLLTRARATRNFLVALTVAGTLSAVLVICQASLLSRAIARVFQTHSASGIGLDAALLTLVFAGRAGFGWLNVWLAHRASADVKSQLRRDLAAARLARPVDATTASATWVTLVTQGLDALDGYYAKYLPQLVLSMTVPLLVGVAIGVHDLESVVIIALTLPLIPVFMALIGWRTQAQVDRRLRVQTRLANHFADLMAGLPTLQVFGRARAQLEGLRRTEGANRRETMATLRISFLSAFALELLATLSVALVAVTIGFRVVFGHMGLGESLFILILAPEVYLPVRQVGATFHDSADGTAAARAALDLIEAAEAPGADRVAPSSGPVRFEGVWFTYPDADHPALPALDLELKDGELIGLTGASGSGKTTALAILMGFLQPSGGRVLIGDADLSEVDLAQWRRQLAYVAQLPGMIAGTVADNVRMGFAGAAEADVRATLDAAGGASLCPERHVGDDGEGLSAGERRRVGMARALLRIRLGGARLLVLDEPTAGLDADTEAAVLTGVRASGAGALVVSHRPAVLASCDRIVELTAAPPADVRPAASAAAIGGQR